LDSAVEESRLAKLGPIMTSIFSRLGMVPAEQKWLWRFRDLFRSETRNERSSAILAVQHLSKQLTAETGRRHTTALKMLRHAATNTAHRRAMCCLGAWGMNAIQAAAATQTKDMKARPAPDVAIQSAQTKTKTPTLRPSSVPPVRSGVPAEMRPPGTVPRPSTRLSIHRPRLSHISYRPRRSDGSGHSRPPTEFVAMQVGQGPVTRERQRMRAVNDTTFPTDHATRLAIHEKFNAKKQDGPRRISITNPPKEWALECAAPKIQKLKGSEKKLNEIALRTLGTPARFPNDPHYCA